MKNLKIYIENDKVYKDIVLKTQGNDGLMILDIKDCNDKELLHPCSNMLTSSEISQVGAFRHLEEKNISFANNQSFKVVISSNMNVLDMKDKTLRFVIDHKGDKYIKEISF